MKKSITLLLLAVMLVCSFPAFAAAPTVKSVTCTAREDGLNDVTVVVNTDSLYQELTLMVLGSDNNNAGNQITVDGKTGYAYYIAQGNTGASKSFTFSFTMDIPETMTDIADYIYVFSGNSSSYVTSQIEEFYYDVTFSVTGNGTVKVGEETIANETVKTVSSGTNFDITVIPDEGYIVKTASFKDAGMIETSDGVYSTGSIGSDGIVVIEFLEDVSVPRVTAYSTPFMENGTTSIVFATLTNTNVNYTLVKYGVVAGKTNDVKIGDEGSYDLVSKTATNSKYQYGIEIVDNENNDYLGRKYFVIPYAVYTDGEEETTFYSNAVEVNFDNE